MPKERIYGEPGDVKETDNDILVMWTKASTEHVHDRDMLEGNVSIALASKQADGWSELSFLTRQSINHLIRVLRNARDGAFGKDS